MQLQENMIEMARGDSLTDPLSWLRENLGQNSVLSRDIHQLPNELVELLKNSLPSQYFWIIHSLKIKYWCIDMWKWWISLRLLILGPVKRLLGEELLTDVLQMVVSLLSNGQLNRDLALTFLDFLFSQISSLANSSEM